MSGWRAGESVEGAGRGSRRSADDIIEVSLQCKHETRTVNGTRGVGGHGCPWPVCQAGINSLQDKEA